MQREVKTIFKCLIGTIVVIVTVAFIVELVNISIYGIQLQQITRTACRKSLDLFTQETYKQRADANGVLGGSVNAPDIVDSAGARYASGEFYSGTTVREIYNSLYAKAYNPDFSNWVGQRKHDGNWRSVNLIDQYLNGYFPIHDMPDSRNYNLNTISDYNRLNADIKSYSNYNSARSLVAEYATPINIGVPYIDEDTFTKMFQWSLSRLISNCNTDLIKYDESGTACIEASGFRVYANQARVTNIEYKVYDMNNVTDRDRFIRDTNINPSKLKFVESVEYMGGEEERDRICTIGVEYSVPVSYVGITPIKHIFDYVANNRVHGWENPTTGYLESQNDSPEQTYSYDVENLTGGGYDGNNTGALPVSSRLVYYLVR